MKNIVVLISGNGSNLQSLIDQIHCKNYARIVAVFSNKEQAYGLERGKQAGIATHFIDPANTNSKDEYDAVLKDKIEHYQPDLILLAGYMKILTPSFVESYLGRLINIHPSLLPKYPGLHTHKKALENNDAQHGVSVHFVTQELDAGPIISQASVPILENDDVDSLAQRVLAQEHIIFPKVVQWFCDDRLQMKDKHAYLDNKKIEITPS